MTNYCTVNLKEATWKALQLVKINYGCRTMDGAVGMLLRRPVKLQKAKSGEAIQEKPEVSFE